MLILLIERIKLVIFFSLIIQLIFMSSALHNIYVICCYTIIDDTLILHLFIVFSLFQLLHDCWLLERMRERREIEEIEFWLVLGSLKSKRLSKPWLCVLASRIWVKLQVAECKNHNLQDGGCIKWCSQIPIIELKRCQWFYFFWKSN